MITRNAASKRGRQNKALGDAFEDWLNTQHTLAGQLGILAHIEKTQAKTKVIGGKLIFEKPGVADYIGCLEAIKPIVVRSEGVGNISIKMPARYFAAEAKSTDDVRLPRNCVEPKQQEHLTAVAKAGGLALLVIEFRGATNYSHHHYAIPWLEVPWIVLRTAESVLEKDIGQWLITPGTCYLSRWHSGGPRSGSHHVGESSTRPRIYPRE
jgi:hypothetical protein